MNEYEEETAKDVSDRATQEEMRITEAARAAATAKEPVPQDWDGETCHTCGEDLIPFRIQNKYFRCVSCQTKLEHKRKGY